MLAVEQQRDREQQREEGGREPVGDRPDRVGRPAWRRRQPVGEVVEPAARPRPRRSASRRRSPMTGSVFEVVNDLRDVLRRCHGPGRIVGTVTSTTADDEHHGEADEHGGGRVPARPCTCGAGAPRRVGSSASANRRADCERGERARHRPHEPDRDARVTANAIANGIAERGSIDRGALGPRRPEDPAVSSGTSVSYGVDGGRTADHRASSRALATACGSRSRSALALVFAFAVTVLVLEIALDAKRVIAWAFTAMAIAALVQPAVEFFSRFMARGLAVLVVVVLVLGSIGFVAYRIVRRGQRARPHRLQEAAPERAAELEARFGSAAGDRASRDRVERLVEGDSRAAAGRLDGRGASGRRRTAASRSSPASSSRCSSSSTGRRLLTGAFAQITRPGPPRRVERVAARPRPAGPRLRARAKAAPRRRRRRARLRDRARSRRPRARRARACGSRSGR